MKKLIMIMTLVLFVIGGCVKSEYVAPDNCYNNGSIIDDSIILKLTNGDPRVIGNLTKTAAIIYLSEHPEYLSISNKVLDTIENYLNQGVTYNVLFAYIMNNIKKIDTVYVGGVIMLMGDFSSLTTVNLPLSECDIALLRKNLNDIRIFYRDIKKE